MNHLADEYDADRAIYILEEMFASSGVDVNTGKVDLGVLEGRPRSEKDKIQLFQDIMKGMAATYGLGATEREIVEKMTDTGKWDEISAKEFIKRSLREGMIYESSPNHFNPMSS